MKKKFEDALKYIASLICIGAMLGTVGFISTGCNKQLIDTTYTFDKAIMYVGGEWITIEISSWDDYEDGDQIQVKDKDGNTYLVHSTNITLIHSADD